MNGVVSVNRELSSGLAKIELSSDNPFDLFKEWHKDACKFSTGLPNALCLATMSKDLKPSARHVVLRRLEDDGFVVYTDNRSRKTRELQDNTSAAMCFLWAYVNDQGQKIARQVRIEGEMKILDKSSYEDIYENELFFCKMRAHVCIQDIEVDWEELKATHDRLLEEVKTGKATLPMPDHFIGYKMWPKTIEFYYARDLMIGDRMLFEKKDADSGLWSHKRLSA